MLQSEIDIERFRILLLLLLLLVLLKSVLSLFRADIVPITVNVERYSAVELYIEYVRTAVTTRMGSVAL